jgi:hypothetical protein
MIAQLVKKFLFFLEPEGVWGEYSSNTLVYRPTC